MCAWHEDIYIDGFGDKNDEGKLASEAEEKKQVALIKKKTSFSLFCLLFVFFYLHFVFVMDFPNWFTSKQAPQSEATSSKLGEQQRKSLSTSDWGYNLK